MESILKRGVSEIIVEGELRRLLETGRPLRLKMGFDPSRPDIHLGHVVGMRKLRQFQKAGHQVIVIVGDWTAQIGDPSGQSQTRPMLTAQEVRANAETYMKQFFKVVDRDKTEVRWQSEWFSSFSLADVIRLTSKFTVAQLLAREDFSKRHAEGRPIAITEFMYPLLQAYDSTVIKSDVEFGGIDQKFNCLMGRELQQMMGQKPQQVLLMPLLVGTDGKLKMSKSLNNYIAIEEPPNDMYGKVMSLPDNLIMDYFELLTDVPDNEIAQFRKQLEEASVNPMLMKKRLAREIVTQFHSPEAADAAQANFEKVVQRREEPEEIEDCLVSKAELSTVTAFTHAGTLHGLDVDPSAVLVDVPHLLLRMGLVRSKSEGKNKLREGAVYVDRQKVPWSPGTGNIWPVRNGTVVRLGNRSFKRVRFIEESR